jgi:hypothetical protein
MTRKALIRAGAIAGASFGAIAAVEFGQLRPLSAAALAIAAAFALGVSVGAWAAHRWVVRSFVASGPWIKP